MKKKLKILIGIIIVLLISLIIFFLVKGINNKNTISDNYFIHYYYDYYIYDIETKKDGIYIEQSVVVQCNVAPCLPFKNDSFKVKYTKEYKTLIEDLFKDKNTKEITIRDSDLNDNEMKIMSKLVKINNDN